jgi:CRP-like cAMP-binding protein
MNMTTKISTEKVARENNENEMMGGDGLKPTMYHIPPTNGVQTSNEAAAAIEPFSQRQRDILYAYVCDQYMLGTTNQEAEEALGMPAQTITPRMLELRKEGLVVDSGMKRKTRSGRRAIVWIDARHKDYDHGDAAE